MAINTNQPTKERIDFEVNWNKRYTGMSIAEIHAAIAYFQWQKKFYMKLWKSNDNSGYRTDNTLKQHRHRLGMIDDMIYDAYENIGYKLEAHSTYFKID